MRAKRVRFDADAGDVAGGCGALGHLGLVAAELLLLEGGNFPRDPDVRKTIAAVAGDFNVEDRVVAGFLNRFDGKPAAHERIAHGLGIKARADKVTEPFEADIHECRDTLFASADVSNHYGKYHLMAIREPMMPQTMPAMAIPLPPPSTPLRFTWV